MDRQVHSNGFTMIESLIVLLIVCVLSIGISQNQNQSNLTIFMEKLMSYCVLMQEKAFIEKRETRVEIYEDHAVFDGEYYEFDESIACETLRFHYNAKGNISKANTLECHDQKGTKKLIFQLGSGRVRID